MWVSNHHGDSFSKIDIATNEVTATIEVPGEPNGVSALFGALWTYTPIDQMIKRVDPATETVVAEIKVDSEDAGHDGMVEADGSVWFPADRGNLVRIDPDTNAVVGEVQVSDAECTGAVAADGTSIWYVPECGSAALHRVDPATGDVTTIPLPVEGVAVTVGLDAVWVVGQEGTLVRVDPAAGEVTASASVGSKGDRVRAGLGSVFVRLDTRNVVVVDPATLEVATTYEFPSAPIPGGGMALTEDSLWVVNFGDGTVDRIAR